MSSDICLLVTVLMRGNELMKCALKCNCNHFPDHPNYHDKELVRMLLPLHVRESGPVVAVEEIFEVAVNYDQA